ncbi:aspartate aminotransferase family protein [Halioglobus japonicus]|uniref:Aspartate aminotransferase family protein n=1 Tax=Halioglobus japonicus TaxID=930805 RepID=A0AAP8MF56_9GAMM|nr:aminotransferase class III-fold pyridoxal phosphate-dependent enzyme [Halioglobus japonicus]AQA18642.1 aspartate aminotransferase family protein [Halioglobus japonicus]PLW86668.1 aspartate aminotransferase family protein [Halioglobus japonicus]GHD11667.1 4-aminobutyrate--2-oxoglutarate transaminase [Halioglobus japonicus]
MSYDLPGDASRALLQRGLPHLRNGIHYTRASQKSASKGYVPPAQFIVGRAEGDYVWDLDGNQYIDFQNGWATNPLGNCHPEILEAVHEAQRQYGFQWEHPLRIPLAERLASIMPSGSLPRFSFEVSGTEAAESAIHLALCHTQRRYIVSFTSCFHGEGLGTKMVSAYNSDNNLYMEGWAGGVLKAPFPYSEEIPAGMDQAQYTEYCLWYIETHLTEYVVPAENIAAILVEPGLAEGGNWIPSKAFMQGLRRICDKFDWLLIADEVLTGLGRTGTMWAVEHFDVVPDILVAGKNLSGGIEPCAGVAARDEILGDNPRATAGSTFAGTPGGCAAALKTLEIYERDAVLTHTQHLAGVAMQRMSDWESRYEIVSQVRGLGLLLGVSFRAGREDIEDFHIARSVRDEMLKRGLWAICDNEPQVRMYPALNMAEDVLLEGLSRMEEAIEAVQRSGGVTIGDYPPMPSGNVGF